MKHNKKNEIMYIIYANILKYLKQIDNIIIYLNIIKFNDLDEYVKMILVID